MNTQQVVLAGKTYTFNPDTIVVITIGAEGGDALVGTHNLGVIGADEYEGDRLFLAGVFTNEEEANAALAVWQCVYNAAYWTTSPLKVGKGIIANSYEFGNGIMVCRLGDLFGNDGKPKISTEHSTASGKEAVAVLRRILRAVEMKKFLKGYKKSNAPVTAGFSIHAVEEKISELAQAIGSKYKPGQAFLRTPDGFSFNIKF